MAAATHAIVGATGAVGRALAQRVVKRGGVPLLIGRSADKLDALAKEHGNAPILVADCSQPESIAEAFKGADADMSSIAAYAYCAGSITLKPVRRASLADFREAFDLNTLSAVEVLKAIEKPLKKNKGACVLFSTIAVQQGLPNHAVVSAAKGAVEGLTRALAAEYAASGVRFNAVAPSLSRSAMAAPMLEKEAIAAALAKAHPLGRLGEPDDLAALADFLLSDDSTWITGQVVGVDGGRFAVA